MGGTHTGAESADGFRFFTDLNEKKIDSEEQLTSNQNQGRDYVEFRPVQYIRIPLTAREGLCRARIYVTAHGVYRLTVNGKRVDNREFAPEITAYEKILQYQTYDITQQLVAGENILGIMLGDGWWCGRVGMSGDSLMYQNKCPSWLYEVEHGATTMWESWGAVSEDGTVGSYSLNHYAFGCVGEWLYREIGGLKSLAPGYKKFRVEPATDCGLSYAKASLHTPYGEAASAWRIEDGRIVLDVLAAEYVG